MHDNIEKLQRLVILFITILCSFAFAGIASAETPLEGAWLLDEMQGADGNLDSDPLGGLMIFTSTHYSIMYAIGEKPRALMDEKTRTMSKLSRLTSLLSRTPDVMISRAANL